MNERCGGRGKKDENLWMRKEFRVKFHTSAQCMHTRQMWNIFQRRICFTRDYSDTSKYENTCEGYVNSAFANISCHIIRQIVQLWVRQEIFNFHHLNEVLCGRMMIFMQQNLNSDSLSFFIYSINKSRLSLDEKKYSLVYYFFCLFLENVKCSFADINWKTTRDVSMKIIFVRSLLFILSLIVNDEGSRNYL